MTRLRLLAAATDELEAAAAWYANEAGRAVAAEFIRAYEGTAALVEVHPEIGTPGPAGTRMLRFRGFPYLLVYRLETDVATVIAIAHQRRRPGYWTRRR